MARRSRGLKLVDKRWGLADHLVQIKGVVEFNERCGKWIQIKEEIEDKIYEDKIRKLENNVKRLRKLIKAYEFGYGDAMRKILSKDREIYLVCQNMSPDMIIEHLKHIEFRQRKAKDKIRYDINQSKLKLFKLETEISLLLNKNNKKAKEARDKKRAGIEYYSSQLEYANTQNDVCKIVLECYKKIIGVLKKDSLHYDAVINSLETDATIQSQTIMKVIELGKLASKDLAWLKRLAKKRAIKFNNETNEHRQEIKESGEAIKTLELINAKLNEYGAKTYPMFQEEEVDKRTDIEMEKGNEKSEELIETLDHLQRTLAVKSVSEVFPQLEKYKAALLQLNKLRDNGKMEHEMLKKKYLQSQAVTEYLEYLLPEEVKSRIKQNEVVQMEFEEEVEGIQNLHFSQEQIMQAVALDKQYFLNLKRMLWPVEIGNPEISDDDETKFGIPEENDDPFGLFPQDNEQFYPMRKGSDDEERKEERHADDKKFPIKLIDFVSMKVDFLYEGSDDMDEEKDCDPEVREVFGDTLWEEQKALEEESRRVFANENIVVKTFKSKFLDSHTTSSSCDKQSRLDLKLLSRQLVVNNEISKEKGEIRFHLHPQGVYRGMYIEKGSSESESEAEADKGQPTEKDEKEEDEEGVQEEESDVVYEESEEEELDSDLDPNEPKPHNCF